MYEKKLEEALEAFENFGKMIQIMGGRCDKDSGTRWALAYMLKALGEGRDIFATELDRTRETDI